MISLASRSARVTLPWRAQKRAMTVCATHSAGVLVPMLPVFLTHDWHAFWEYSISYQANRSAPFSIWGMWGGADQSLKIPQRLVLGGAAALALAAGIWPRGDRSVVEVAALGAAIIIVLQCSISYWFYLYIVWFLPLVPFFRSGSGTASGSPMRFSPP